MKADSAENTLESTIVTDYDYIYTGDKLAQMTVTTQVDDESPMTETLYFAYDASGSPMAVTYNGTTYYYVTNLQGDVTAILDNTGTSVVEYAYDAWGNILTSTGSLNETLGETNPLRYRGYVYDTETGLYYVSSRYYDSAIGRWINADIPETLIADFESFAQYNLFAYCFNNPVNLSDETGTWPSWATKLTIGFGAIVIGAVVVAATAATGGAAVAFTGALIAGVKTATLSGVIAAGTSATVTAVVSVASGDDVKTVITKTASAAVDGFVDGFMWGGISFGASHVAGYVTSKTGIFKRNVTYGKNNFMFGNSELTIWRHGPDFRIDASPTRGLHYHMRTASTGIGQHRTQWIPEIIGVISGLFSAVE